MAAVANRRDILARDLDTAVLAGQLAPQMARELMATEEFARRGAASAASKLDEARAKLHEQVLAGEISAEQADAEIAAARRVGLVSKTQLHNSMKDLLTQLKAEVKSGSMTIEEAQAALEALKAELANEKRQ
jgi:hypothetical protein